MSMVKFRTGISGDLQQSTFINATFQEHRDLAFSIATRVAIPPDVKTEQQLAFYLAKTLSGIPGDIQIDVQIGKASC